MWGGRQSLFHCSTGVSPVPQEIFEDFFIWNFQKSEKCSKVKGF
jgi:hypothetical protein